MLFALSPTVFVEHSSQNADFSQYTRMRGCTLRQHSPSMYLIPARGTTLKVCGTICPSCHTCDCLGAICAITRFLLVLIVAVSSSTTRSVKQRVRYNTRSGSKLWLRVLLLWLNNAHQVQHSPDSSPAGSGGVHTGHSGATIPHIACLRQYRVLQH